MNSFIHTHAQLRAIVNISLRADFDTLTPYLDAAADPLTELLGEELLQTISAYQDKPTTAPDLTPWMETIIERIRAFVAPRALELYTPEASYHIGDSGFTVDRTDSLAPADHRKIADATRAYALRAEEALNRLLTYLESIAPLIPEWEHSDYRAITRLTHFHSTRQLEQEAGVMLGTDPQFLYRHHPHFLAAAMQLRSHLPDALHTIALTQPTGELTPALRLLNRYARALMAHIALHRISPTELRLDDRDQSLLRLQAYLRTHAQELNTPYQQLEQFDNPSAQIFAL